MPTLLLINPNTSSFVSELLHRHVQAELGTAAQLRTLTARFGAPYIASEASHAVAQHAVLDAWAVARSQGAKPDAVLIGCFGDPGLFALREGAGVPVSGPAEALGYAGSLAGIHTVARNGRWRRCGRQRRRPAPTASAWPGRTCPGR